MTKLEALFSYTPAQRRDAWISLGSQQVDGYTKVFIKGTLFRLVETGPTITLNGCVFYVTENFTDSTFEWEGYSLDDPATGSISKNSISHPYLKCVLTQAEFNAITTDFDPAFIPFQGADQSVIIDDLDLENILFEVGVPFMEYEELEYTREEILRNAVWPAMKEYFKWFPIIELETHPMGAGGKFEIDIPPYAYTAQRVYLIPGFGMDVYSRNPFYMSWAQGNSGFGFGTSPVIGSPMAHRGRQRFVDIQGFSTYILERAARQGAVNYAKRTRIRISIQKRKVIGFANQIGNLEIEWAVNSNDWNDIPYQRQSEVRDLAKAYILRGLAMLRKQTPKDVPGILNVDDFLSRAVELEKTTLDNLRSATKAVVVRS